MQSINQYSENNFLTNHGNLDASGPKNGQNEQLPSGNVTKLRQVYGEHSSKKATHEKMTHEAAEEVLHKKVKQLMKRGLLHYSSYSEDILAQRYELVFSLANEIANYPDIHSAFEDVNKFLQKQ